MKRKIGLEERLRQFTRKIDDKLPIVTVRGLGNHINRRAKQFGMQSARLHAFYEVSPKMFVVGARRMQGNALRLTLTHRVLGRDSIRLSQTINFSVTEVSMEQQLLMAQKRANEIAARISRRKSLTVTIAPLRRQEVS